MKRTHGTCGQSGKSIRKSGVVRTQRVKVMNYADVVVSLTNYDGGDDGTIMVMMNPEAIG